MNDRYVELFEEGIRLFDAGEFFEAHEAWEALWRAEAEGPRRLFLQGLIQAAAAFHKLFVMRSPDSAARLLKRALAKLEACPSEVEEARLTAFKAELYASVDAVSSGRLTRAEVPVIRALSR